MDLSEHSQCSADWGWRVQDVEQLKRVLAPSLGLLDQMAAGSALGDSAGASLQQLISRTKDSLLHS